MDWLIYVRTGIASSTLDTSYYILRPKFRTLKMHNYFVFAILPLNFRTKNLVSIYLLMVITKMVRRYADFFLE